MNEPGESADDPLCAAAATHFGVSYLFPYQRLVISNTLEAAGGVEDSVRRHIVLLPTGAGKSLCFQLPAALLDGCTVVVYPLLSLIADQARRLSASSIRFAVMTGSTDRTGRRAVLESVQNGETRVVLTNPETLCSPMITEALTRSRIDHIVMDEAHCVCEWGETFRPAYIEVGEAVRSIAPRVVTAFTATASPYVLQSIRRHLFADQPTRLLSANPDRPNICYYVIPGVGGIGALCELLGADRSGPTRLGFLPPLVPVLRPAIVFCRSRSGTQITASRLRRVLNDDRIHFYHAGLNNDEKRKIERWFFDSDDGILVATCAYGMGVDKANIRTVIHPEAAPTVESFLQESGRAGRDGNPALSVTLAPYLSAASASPFAETMSVDSPLPASSAASLEAMNAQRRLAMQRFLRTDGCRRSFLLHAMGSEPVECSGCDHCDRRLADDIVAVRLIGAAVRKNRRSMSRRAFCRLLSDRLHARDRDRCLHHNRSRGLLCGWSINEVDEVLTAAIAAGSVRVHRRGPWKGMVDAPRFRRVRAFLTTGGTGGMV